MTHELDPSPDPFDLSARARLGRLSSAERLAFERALAEDAELRLAHELGRDFDLLSRVRSGDEALVERAAERAWGGAPRRTPRRFSRLGLLLAATFVIGSAAAAVQSFVFGERERMAVSSAQRAAPAAPRTPAEPAAGRGAPALGEAAAAPEVAPPALPPASGARAPRSAAPGAAPPAVEDTAAALFRRAGAARRAGDFEAARALFVELQATFPGSNEARVSHVSLGKLYLAAGRAREAELEFSKYLRAGAGDLREEALVGRAGALGALGRSAEERNVWEELLRRHPSSVYAARARERLRALDERAP